MNVSKSDYQSIQRWMYRNARPIDLARWQYHFENGNSQAVLSALSAYQNEDGGFGHALEPDIWNPNSSPYSTSVAINMLEEIKFRDREHAIIQKILKYLETTPEFDGEYWPAIINTNQDHPHAPWWVDRSYDWGYTPTVLLTGFGLFYAAKDSSLYQTAEKIVGAAIQKYLFGSMPNGDAYHSVRREGEIHCFTKMLTFLENTADGHAYPTAELNKVMSEQAEKFTEKDAAKWNQYCWKPSVFVKSPDSIFYPGNEKAIEDELDYILSRRNPEGIWDINWAWGAYENEFSLSKNWWKANIIIENLNLLKNFGRLAYPLPLRGGGVPESSPASE
jgi:hypothetical protein